MAENEIVEIDKINDFKVELQKVYHKTLINFLKSEKNANKFLSSVVYSIQKTPKLLNCDKTSLMTAFMTCASYWMYPSSAGGECYIIPYEKKKKQWNVWVVDYTEAQFQLWYQWMVKILYDAGIQSIRADIIRKNDKFSYINWKIQHSVDIFKSAKDRWAPVWAYVIVKVNWEEIGKAMNSEDILKFKEFSKSAKSDYSPWNISKDPELWMWIKTVLKQIYKLLPKNEQLTRAIEEDNKDSIISEKEILEMPTSEIINKSLEDFWKAEEGEPKKITEK